MYEEQWGIYFTVSKNFPPKYFLIAKKKENFAIKKSNR
jgi:hypothetical protein